MSSFRRFLPVVVLVAVTSAACKKVPDAPSTFHDLCAYVYEHHPDEDSTALATGLDELASWLGGHLEEAGDGYQVGILSQETMDSLDEQDRTAEGMVGLAVAQEAQHSVDDATCALVLKDQSQLFPDSFSDYQRDYLSDPDCFIEHGCLRLETLEYLTSEFPLGLSSVSVAHNQYLWVETSTGTAMVQRNWQVEPPEVNFSWMEVDQQAYLNVFLPRGTGSAVFHVQAQWTVYSQDNDVPENFAFNLVVNYMQDFHVALEEWLDENGSCDG